MPQADTSTLLATVWTFDSWAVGLAGLAAFALVGLALLQVPVWIRDGPLRRTLIRQRSDIAVLWFATLTIVLLAYALVHLYSPGNP